MAKLTAARRRKLKPSQFGLPRKKGKSGYPLDTRGRAVNAKARATQQMNKGNISRSTRDKIHARANRALKRKKK